MTVSDIVKNLNLEVYCGAEGLSREVSGGYVSDLLSDVMGNAQEGNVWVTLQTHKNIMAIASLRDLAAIICVKGLKPDNDTIEASNQECIPVLGTKEKSFEITGKLFNFITCE
jgi:predicted transcriptional regulator